jgi:glycosyltransferase involved in cell wall biosynthesis
VSEERRISVAASPGWPITDVPLRIALLGWARLPLQEREGTAYNLSASELAAGLAMSGHRVSYLRSGLTYTITRGLHVRAEGAWRGVECHDLVNSPNLSPAARNFSNMRAELSSPRQTRVVLGWLDSVGAQVVHIHSLEGFPVGLLPAIRHSGRPVVVTLHNYWYVCPQVDLLYEEQSLCTDYEAGRRCVNCRACTPAGRQRRRSAVLQDLERRLGGSVAAAARAGFQRLRAVIRRDSHSESLASPEGGSPVDDETALGFQVFDGDRHDGTIDHGLSTLPSELPPLDVVPWHANETFLANTEKHRRSDTLYGRRRIDGISSLSQASLVTAPSEFMRRVHVALGVPEENTRLVELGQPHLDRIHRRARRSPFYDVRPWDPKAARRPLRFAFHGSTGNNKGLITLMRAIPLLAREVRQQSQFLVRASGSDWHFRRLVSRYPEVQFAGGYDPLQLLASWGEYDVAVLCHVWFDNSPIVMLEHLHGGKFVVSPRLGGPPEWIRPPDNGLLYPAGDAGALAECISRLVRGEVAIPSPRELHEATPLRSYPEHVGEVEAIYREVIGPW